MKYRTQLIEKKHLSPDVGLYRFKLVEQKFSYLPGQFVMVSVGWNAEKRPFSIASPPFAETIDLCMKIIPNGAVSGKLESADQNTEVLLEGPYGRFTLEPEKIAQDQNIKEIIFIAGGTGIAPLRSMIQALLKIPNPSLKVWLFFRFRSEENFLFRNELEALAKQHKNFKLVPSVSNPPPGWKFETERIHSIIDRYVTDKTHNKMYICGPPPMIKDTLDALLAKGFKKENILREAWD